MMDEVRLKKDREHMSELVTEREISKRLNIAAGSNWLKHAIGNGKLQRAGHGPRQQGSRGPNLYRWDDVVRLRAQTQRSPMAGVTKDPPTKKTVDRLMKAVDRFMRGEVGRNRYGNFRRMRSSGLNESALARVFGPSMQVYGRVIEARGTFRYADMNRIRHMLTEEQVGEIRVLLAEGKLTAYEIGCVFGVSDTAIRKIRSGHTWKSVPT